MSTSNKLIEIRKWVKYVLLELIKGIILGIVEGLTEFAPVSSTGHMILVDDMWLKSTNFLGSQSAFTFKVVIQLGSVFAASGYLETAS